MNAWAQMTTGSGEKGRSSRNGRTIRFDRISTAALVCVCAMLMQEQTGAQDKPDKITMAIIQGEGAGQPSPLLEPLLTQMLTEQTNVQLVERQHLERILREQSLSKTALLDQHILVRVGQLISADAFEFLVPMVTAPHNCTRQVV